MIDIFIGTVRKHQRVIDIFIGTVRKHKRLIYLFIVTERKHQLLIDWKTCLFVNTSQQYEISLRFFSLAILFLGNTVAGAIGYTYII